MPFGNEPPDPHYNEDVEIRAELSKKTRAELEDILRHPTSLGIPLSEFLPELHSEKRRRIAMELLGAFDSDPTLEGEK